jgi:polysaccharide export outer membrane protein
MNRATLAFTTILCLRAFAQVPAASEPPKPAEVVCAPVDPKTYVIGAQDVLSIRLFRDTINFSGSYVVRPDGRITLARIHDVQAAGLTPDQLTAHLTEALMEDLVRPEVIINVQEVNSKLFHIQGEVNRQGAFSLASPTTIFDALGNAGGFREFAKRSDVLVLRADGRILHFDWMAYTKGKKREQNVLLENGDTIVVN